MSSSVGGEDIGANETLPTEDCGLVVGPVPLCGSAGGEMDAM